jgi:hypothetical protein
MPELTDINLYLFLVLALVAEVLGTLGGFGSSLLFVPIASYFFSFQTALGITALFHVLSNLTKIVLFKKGIDKFILIWVGIPAVIFVSIGAWLSQFLTTSWLELALGIFLVLTSIAFFMMRNNVLKPTRNYAILGGTVSGFIAGAIGTGGAIRGLTLTAFQISTPVFIATSAFIDLAIDSSRSIVYFFNGYIKADILYLMPPLLLVSVLGTYIGKRLLSKFSDKQFKQMVLLLVFLTGVSMLYKALWAA